MDEPVRNYPLDAVDRETIVHPATSIVEHLAKGPHIIADALDTAWFRIGN